MAKNQKYALLTLLACSIPSYANDTGFGHCALDAQIAKYPELRSDKAQQAKQTLNTFTQKFLSSSSVASDQAQEEIVIPVVFHVVYAGDPGTAVENISDEQIIESLKQLNEDFNGQNARRSGNIHSAFQSIEANVGIEFKLASYDPDGYPTSGINRVESVFTSDGGQIEVKQTIQWPRDEYLNIWVVRSSDGKNGSAFAFTPDSVVDRPVFDGIVTSHWAVGRTGTAVDTHYGNLTHEVGHWANLHHVWGSTTSNGKPEACDDDDGVFDTPNTSGHSDNNVCGSSVNSCGTQDNVSNFMDYSCEVMYTNDQSTRMLAALNSSVSGRNNLWKASNKVNTGVTDVSVRALFNADKSFIAAGSSVQFSDQSIVNEGSEITQWVWEFPGGSPERYEGQTPPEVTYENVGSYEVTLTVTNDQGENSRTRSSQVEVDNIVLMPRDSDTASVVVEDYSWFYDSEFKGTYKNSQNSTMTFYPAQGKVINVDFYEFNMEAEECQWDYMEIYDGDSSTAPLIGKFCGKDVQPTIQSTHSSGALTFKFVSDDNTNIPGWRAKVQSVDANVQSNDILLNLTETSSVNTCSATLWDSGKYLPYKNSKTTDANGDVIADSGVVTILPDSDGGSLIAQFASFETEADGCQWDFLEVFDGDSTGAPLIGKFCGAETPANIVSENGALTFKFTADGNTTKEGFEIDLSCEGNQLENGVSQTSSATQGNEVHYSIDVPAQATSLNFSISGGDGDADLYVRYGEKPTTDQWDCRPYVARNNESCPVTDIQAGTYYIMLRAYRDFNNVDVVATFEP